METLCRRCHKNFLIDQNDQIFYQKMKVPNPTECQECRFMCKAMWRNETTLYSRTCDMCQKGIISMYNPASPYVVYCHNCFYSEKWDPTSYALSYDQSRPFFEQLNELLIRVPKIATYLTKGDGDNVNSEYVNMASGCKNSYLVFNTSLVEDCMYSRGLRGVKDSSDLYFAVSADRCYDSINVQNSSGILWSQNVVNCVDSYFIANASNLINCFGCVNLRNKTNHWFNEELTKEEYDKRLSAILGSYTLLEAEKKKFEEFKKQFPHRESNNIKTIHSTGDYLSECKNVKDSFEITKSEDCRYLFASKEIKDSLGTIGYGAKAEQLLECVATGHSSNVIGTYGAEGCQNILLSSYVGNCRDCIGCDGIRNKEYFILNKQYTKEEYVKLRDHIINELIQNGDYGLIIPPPLAPFGYNETIAYDNMPLDEAKAKARGFKWQSEIQKTTGKETLKLEEIPDNILNISDTITDEVLSCIECSRNYKLTEQELFFYRRMKIPVPRRCFFCRHRARIERRGPYKFWERACALCKKNITTNYAQERPEIVYCEECYKKEVL